MRSNYSLYLKTFFKQHKVLAQEVPTALKNTYSGLPQSQDSGKLGNTKKKTNVWKCWEKIEV